MAGRPPLSPADVDGAYAAAQKVVETHQRVADFLRAGQTLFEIDAYVARTLSDLGARSCFLDYRPRSSRVPPFPCHACLSVNDCVVHGTSMAHQEPMKPGDVLKIDVGVAYRGWIGDAAWTYVFGPPAPEIRRLMDCGKESLRRGIATLHPRNTYMAWAEAVQGYVERDCGFGLIRGMGGHGYGRVPNLHGPPFVSNVVASPLEWPEGAQHCEPGTLIAVEPMIAAGSGEIEDHPRAWPVRTRDGSVTVHYEHDVLITESGPRVLTEGMDDLPDVIR